MIFRKVFTVALILCLALSLNLPACTLESEEAPPPEAAAANEVAVEPSSSEVSSEPEVSDVPEVSMEQEILAEPEEPVEPIELEEPEEAEEAEESEEPEESEGSEESEEPEVFEESEEPGVSEEPEDSEGSEGSEEPEDSEEPEESKEPEEPEVSQYETAPEMVSGFEDEIIDVAVPAYGQIIINPYHLKVGENEDTAQIIHHPQELVNYNAFPVTVDISVEGTVPEESEALLVSGYPSELAKEVLLYVEFQNDPDSWATMYTGASNQLIATTDGSYSKNILTLDAGSTGYFRFSGAMSSTSLWEDTDTFGAVLVYSFSAASAEAPDEADVSEMLSEAVEFADADIDEPSASIVPD